MSQGKSAPDFVDEIFRVAPQPEKSSLRRALLKILPVVIAFFGTIALFRLWNAPPKYQPKYQTIAHRYLDLENRYSAVPDESYELLDEVIDDVKANAHFDPTVTDPGRREKQLLELFHTIDSICIGKNFIFPSGAYTVTLGEALEDNNLNADELKAALAMPHNARRVVQMQAHADEPFHLIACIPSAFLYAGIAETLGLELQLLMLPDHVFVRAASGDNRWVNWDANRCRSISDEEYIRDWRAADWQVAQKIFMNPLSDDQKQSLMYCCIASLSLRTSPVRGRQMAIECNRKAIALDPQNFVAQNNLAQDLLFCANPSDDARAEAQALSDRAVAMQPNDAFPHATAAFVHASYGRTQAAVTEMKRAVEFDPANIDYQEAVSHLEAGETMFQFLKSKHPILFWLVYEFGWLYVPTFLVIAGVAAMFYRLRKRTDALALLPPTMPIPSI